MVVDFFSENWFGILSVVLGIIVSYYFYRKSLLKALPAYQTKSIRIIDIQDKINIDNVEIKYNNKQITRLSKSFLVFWNNGNKTIEGKDIVDEEKLRIVFDNTDKDGEILSCKVIKVTRKINNFTITQNKQKSNEAIIDFTYLDARDGAVVEILHSFKNPNITINGAIKGIPSGVKYYGQVLHLTSPDIKKPKAILRIAVRITLFIYGILGTLLLYSSFNTSVVLLPKWLTKPSPILIPNINKWLEISTGILFILPTIFFLLNPKNENFLKN